MKYPIKPISASSFNLDFLGKKSYNVDYLTSLDNCDYTSITFYKGEDTERASSIEVGILILNIGLKDKIEKFEAKTILFCKNPMLLFAKIIGDNYDNDFSDSTLRENKKVTVSEFAYVEDKVVLGNGTKVFPNVTIFDKTSIGDNCVIQSGSVIGGFGMSYVQDQEKEYHKIVQLGNLIIEDNVDIGTNTSVLRGILETTVVGKGTKIGNNVNVGHNVVIGKNCYISSGVTIGGACVIGDNCWISPGVSISDHINIGSNSKIGVGSVVIKEVLSDSFYLGNPARKLK